MKVSILIPCRNEELTIAACIDSCIHQSVRPFEIIVVNDGSTDRTTAILAQYAKKYRRTIRIINNPGTGQKSYAQQLGLQEVRGEIVVCTDADSVLDRDFIKLIVRDFQNPEVAAVGGYVKSKKYNWLTASRAFDYAIGQNIYKLAQDHIGYILVIPGAAGAFRTSVLAKKIVFGHDTLTEDLDITYQLHKKGYKIVFDRDAIAYTQDPINLRSYIGQMRRWYGGGWQNLRKHFDKTLISHPGRTLELSLTYVEGLVYSLLLYIVPVINLRLTGLLLLIFFVVLALQSVYASWKEKRRDLLLVPFYYPIVMYINSAIFIEQFFRECILRTRNMQWHQPQRVAI
jgi:cellulose synthase/poly-beta-1,6-N-acetylglucosamine synthase-like glycosyltransferase